MRIRTRGAVTALATAVVTLTLTAPATGEQVTVVDGSAQQSGSDILRVHVDHAPRRVFVRVTVDDLRTASSDSNVASIFFDTRKRRPGPEFVLGMPLDGGSSGNDRWLDRMRNWRETTGVVGKGVSSLRYNYHKDVIRTWASRKALNLPDQVRVGVKTGSSFAHPSVFDWLIGKRRFTRWLDHP